jgi:hypothetical protein
VSAKIKWKLEKFTRPKGKKLWGETSAKSKTDVCECLTEQWIKLFGEILPVYDLKKWDSLNCHVEVDNGAMDIGPLLGTDPMTGLPGCSLVFTWLRDKVQSYDGDDENNFDDEQALLCDRFTFEYAALLLEAWEKARKHESVAAILAQRTIPLRILNVLSGRKAICKVKLRTFGPG